MTTCEKEIAKLYNLIPEGWFMSSLKEKDIENKSKCIELYIKWIEQNLDVQTRNVEYLSKIINENK